MKNGQASMVVVGEKPVTHREAAASGSVWMHKETLAMIRFVESPQYDWFQPLFTSLAKLLRTYP